MMEKYLVTINQTRGDSRLSDEKINDFVSETNAFSLFERLLSKNAKHHFTAV